MFGRMIRKNQLINSNDSNLKKNHINVLLIS